MRPVVAFDATGAGENVGADTDADVGVGASDGGGEDDGTGSSCVTPPEGEIPLAVIRYVDHNGLRVCRY